MFIFLDTSGTHLVSNKSKNGPKLRPKAGFMPPVEDLGINDEDSSDEWEDVDDEEEYSESVVEEGEEDQSEALPQKFCLFCPHESVSIEDNLRHMSKSHSFFVPDLQFVTDLEAFFVYLGAKVGDGRVCLLCNNSKFVTVRACQAHMVDKGHCTLQYEGDAMLEYADFYDFSSTYPDIDDSTDLDSEISVDENGMSVDPNTLELLLPTGARAGHRALRRYYKQNISPVQIKTRTRAMINGLEGQYKALGLHGTILTVAVRRRITAKKMENRQLAYHRVNLGVKANKLQKHFRKQQLYCG